MRCAIFIAVIFCFHVLLPCADAKDVYEPMTGDIVFQSWPHNPLTDAIETATHSPYSHCGIVIKHGSAIMVLEAKPPVVTETTLTTWIDRGRNHGVVVYRLIPAYSARVDAMIKVASGFLGRPYDIHYDFDDERIYCSELVFKAFKKAAGEDLGVVRRLGDLDWKPIEAIIREIEQGKLPLDRKVITPKDLSEAKQLQLVFKESI